MPPTARDAQRTRRIVSNAVADRKLSAQHTCILDVNIMSHHKVKYIRMFISGRCAKYGHTASASRSHASAFCTRTFSVGQNCDEKTCATRTHRCGLTVYLPQVTGEPSPRPSRVPLVVSAAQHGRVDRVAHGTGRCPKSNGGCDKWNGLIVRACVCGVS